MGTDLSINKEIEKYINNNSSKLHDVQKEIISHNESMGDIKKMQISISQCNFLNLIIKLTKVKKILEIGTFTGLSALSMSLALPENGSIVALDKNPETSEIAKIFFKKAGQDKKINMIIGPALDSLKSLEKDKQNFDLVFIDADKENYINYFNQSINLINKNGLIIVDNILWYGDVADNNKQDRFTLNIRDFNSYVNNDRRVENLIIPLGDGLSVCRKL